MLFEGLGTGGDVCFLEFLCFGCFSKGSSTTVPFCRYLGYESLSVLLLGERLWMAALGIEQNKAQSELQQAALEKQQHSVIQPLACALEHCVYICNLTYPLGSRRPPPPPLPPFFPFIPSHSHSFLLSIFSLSQSPSYSVAHIIASFPFPLTQRYSQANTPTRFLTLTPIHTKNTKGLEDTPRVRSQS